MKIGPYQSHEIVLCSADAGPNSQKANPDYAQYFFPGGKWVGALRNAAAWLHSDFLILTTQHGLVEPRQIISPYDLHIIQYPKEVAEKWEATFPARLTGSGYRLMIFYAGGCPRYEMIEVMLPLLRNHGIALLTFGRPNMYDVDKLDAIWEMLLLGTTDNKIKSILKVPERFEYYSADCKDIKINYYVYENWRAESKAIIHTGSCGHCKEGRGCHKNVHEDRNGKWHGPFLTLKEAERGANATGRPVGRHRCV